MSRDGRGDPPRPDGDEVDRRFLELVRAEFGEQPPAQAARADRQPAPLSVEPDRDVSDFDIDDQIDYRAISPPNRPWSRPVRLGVTMSSSGMALALIALLGGPLPLLLSWASVVLMVGGVAVLMSVALRRHRDPDDQPGAQV